ncbi:hypothetical protein RM530_07830 [Algiphilus sp. W345]|uniref:Uncharacterized protein n=1 Tax=Banduia mediterranea TaxID=3075609 RepID=A0ABU2WJ58_9GAMM|nr:cytochrome oxidase putative small subunit CydP [Algiphilus sp. W345]MDT0497274.1 hypothetical protein [Algiphilus sp. W345]
MLPLTDRRLLRDIIIILVIKLIAIMVIWQLFVDDHRVAVDDAKATSAVLGPPPMPPVIPMREPRDDQ